MHDFLLESAGESIPRPDPSPSSVTQAVSPLSLTDPVWTHYRIASLSALADDGLKSSLEEIHAKETQQGKYPHQLSSLSHF